MAKTEQKPNDQGPQEAAPLEMPATVGPLTLLALALKHGQMFVQKGKDGKFYPTVPAHDSPIKRTHLLADALHGWTKYERQTSESVKLSDDDYLAALAAAKAGKTHAPANKRTAEEATAAQASRDAAKGA